MNSLSAIASAFMETFNTGNFDAMLEYFSRDSVYIDPYSAEHVGVSAIADALAPSFEVSDSKSQYQITSAIVDECQCSALVTWTLLITAADGTKSAIEGLDILHIRDGKILLKNAFCKANELSIRQMA